MSAFSKKLKFSGILCLLSAVWACSSVPVEYKYPEKVKGKYEMPSERVEEEKQDTFFGKKGFNLFPEKKVSESGIGVNTYLWQGTLETLSFMPLASADPFGGVIITDWYAPEETPSERFKINALILTKTLRADGLKVTVFRQIKEKGTWVDVKTDPAVALKMENAILTKARQLRLAATQ